MRIKNLYIGDLRVVTNSSLNFTGYNIESDHVKFVLVRGDIYDEYKDIITGEKYDSYLWKQKGKKFLDPNSVSSFNMYIDKKTKYMRKRKVLSIYNDINKKKEESRGKK